MSVQTVVDAIADRLVLRVEELNLNPKVRAYKWAVGPGSGFDAVPAAVVEIPTIGRTHVDAAEDHLGARDLYLTFQVIFVFDATSVDTTMPDAVEAISAFIDAIDADPDLGGNALEAKVISSEPSNVEDAARPLFGYVAEVEVLAFL